MPISAGWISRSELRLAGRLLRTQPIVTLTTVLALTVGIGMATTGFTLLESVLFSRLPFSNMIAAGLLSGWVPARRALAIAPADALRAE